MVFFFTIVVCSLWTLVAQGVSAHSLPATDHHEGSTPVPLLLPSVLHKAYQSRVMRGDVPTHVLVPGYFAPIVRVKVGKATHNMIISADTSLTVFDPAAKYHGGQRTPFIYNYTTRDGERRADQIFLDDITLGGVTAKKAAVGLANVPFLSKADAKIKDKKFAPAGWLSIAPENARGYDLQDPSLLGFGAVIDKAVTLKYAPRWDGNDGLVHLPGLAPDFWVNNIADDLAQKPVYAVSVTIAGVKVPRAKIYTSSFMSRASEALVRQIFEASGLTPENEEEDGGLSVVAKVDCAKGHPLKLEFEGGGTINVPGLSNMWKPDDKNGSCYSTLRSSSNADAWFGYALFRAAFVTFDTKGDGKLGLRQGPAHGHASPNTPEPDKNSRKADRVQ